MPLRKIARLGEPILRRRADPVPESDFGSPRLAALVQDMLETMRDVGGAGLAAPQIGESVQVVVIEVRSSQRYPDFPDIPLTILINPELTPMSGAGNCISVYEGCLSVPGLRGRVTRPACVRLRARRPDGSHVDELWEDVAAAVVQHEVDHLQGTLFVDRVDPRTLCFLDEYERNVPRAQRVVRELAREDESC